MASTHHEGDLLAGLRLPADHDHAASEDEETHAQRRQDPHLRTEDAADVVRGEIADHAHNRHCGWRRRDDTENQMLNRLRLFNTSSKCFEPELEYEAVKGGLPTEHTDGHVDHTGGLFRGREGRVQDSLQGGAATLQHVEVGLGLGQVGLALFRRQVILLTYTPLQRPVRLVPGQQRLKVISC